jgi:hypothetical protein
MLYVAARAGLRFGSACGAVCDMCRVCQNHTYRQFFSWEPTKCAVKYGVYTRFWPTLCVWYVYVSTEL